MISKQPHRVPFLPIQPLEAISPSRFVRLQTCPLREVWGAASRPLLPSSPQSAIGTIIHNLWEEAFAGKFSDGQSVNDAWEKAVAVQEGKMTKDWKRAHLVPLSVSAKQMEVERQRVVRQLSGWTGRGQSKIQSEKTLTDSSKHIVGRVDMIVSEKDRVTLVDLKTGKLHDADGNLKEEYVQQLKLYAALYYEEKKEWPDAVTLRTNTGEDYDVPFTPSECQLLLTQALELRLKINALVEQGSGTDSLARPAPAVCKHCSFRPACSSYWKARHAHPEEGWPIDVIGTIQEVTTLGTGLLKICLDDGKASFHIRGLTPSRHQNLEEKRSILFCNLHSENTEHFSETALTTNYQSPDFL